MKKKLGTRKLQLEQYKKCFFYLFASKWKGACQHTPVACPPLFPFASSRRKEVYQKGQSLVEALILSLVLITFIKLIFVIFWVFTNVLWIEHQLYQGLLCAAQQKEMQQCKYTTLQKIKKLSSLGTIQSLKIKEFQNKWKGEVQWSFYKRDFFIKQSLQLPQ